MGLEQGGFIDLLAGVASGAYIVNQALDCGGVILGWRVVGGWVHKGPL